MSRTILKEQLVNEISSMLDAIAKDCMNLQRHPLDGLGCTLQNTWKLYHALGKLQMLHELDYVDPEKKD